MEAHADRRGSSQFNKLLSQRRADRVKSYLTDHGVPFASIETRAFGKEKNLTDKEVRTLIDQNSNIGPDDRKRLERNLLAFCMANNRRVDILLGPAGHTSLRFFP